MATGAVFDCDGTLLDSMEAWHIVQSDLAKRAGIVSTDELTVELGPMTIPEAGAYLHAKYGVGIDADDVVGMIDEGMLAYYRTSAQPRPGALEFVRALVDLGVSCSVASSSPQSYLQAGLEHAGFAPYLDAIVSVDDVGASKREPAVFNQACKLMGTSIAETWGFEDSLYALRTLKRAGYRTVGVYDTDLAGTFEELSEVADVTVRSFFELDVRRFAR
ncbi:HAD family hydrolase [Raoultibacter phocaeensis]|uniref:HAD family hydrolase n=1 Tax=Raoultibacter phocaeensis TaxID=2479841 RepID=UPI0011184D61|nr:HAD family phosphatase [Raoultibacter phocaeensis]